MSSSSYAGGIVGYDDDDDDDDEDEDDPLFLHALELLCTVSRVTIQLYMSGNRSKNSWTCLFWENINGSLFFPQRYTAHFLHDVEND